MRLPAFVFILSALAGSVSAQAPGIYAGGIEASGTSFFLTVPEAPGPLVLAVSHLPQGANWSAFGEYEGRAKQQGQAWSVSWKKIKSTQGNFPVPASTTLTRSGDQLLLALPGRSVALKKQTLQQLIFSGMYSDEPFNNGDVLFVSAGGQYLCARRRPAGGAEIISFSRGQKPAVLTLASFQVRLTRFLKLDPEAGAREGTGLLMYAKGRDAFRIHFDGMRTPASDAMLTVFREGKAPVEYSGTDHHNRWKRKGSPLEIVDSFGEFRRLANEANPLGLWFKAELKGDVEEWTAISGGQNLQWWISNKDTPADGALILPDKTRIEFAVEVQP